MSIRRIIAAASVGAVALWLAQPALRRAAASMHTSSSPGVGAYDLVAGVLLQPHYARVAGDCATALAGTMSPAILEIGPGPGHLAVELLHRLPDATWTGLDVDSAMLQAADRRLERAGLRGSAALVEGDVAAMPFADGSFDLIVSSLSAHHWPQASIGFAEIRRVLRRGGRALVYDLPVRWGRLETGHAGLAAADDAFEAVTWERVWGVGPATIVWRVDLHP